MDMSKKSLLASLNLRVCMLVCAVPLLSAGVAAQTVSTGSAVTAAPIAKASAADAALDKAVANLQIEKIVAQVLSSIDPQAIADVADRAAQDVAAGKEPQINNPKAVQDMQTAMQKQVTTLAPRLIHSLVSMLAPIFNELKSEMADSFKAD
jgi:hypothetical protein